MADITVTAASVGAVQKILTMDGPITGTLNVGDYATLDASTGKWKRGDADAAATAIYGGLVIEKNGNAKVTVLIIGVADCGDGVSGDYGTPIYLSDTAGSLADTAGTVQRLVGIVVPMNGHTTPTKGVLFHPCFQLDGAVGIAGAVSLLSTLAVTGAATFAGNVTLGNAFTDVIDVQGSFNLPTVTDAGPMTATNGTEGDLVYNLSNDKVYVCTTTGTPGTWGALH